MSPFQAKPDASETCNYSWLPPPAAIAPVPFQDTSWSCLAFCLRNPKPVDQAHLPIERKKNSKEKKQYNEAPPSFPHPSVPPPSQQGEAEQRWAGGPPSYLHGRQSPEEGSGCSLLTAPSAPTCCRGRPRPAEQSFLLHMHSLARAEYLMWPSPRLGPNCLGSGKQHFECSLFSSLLPQQGLAFLGHAGSPPRLELWAGKATQAETTSLMDHQKQQDGSSISIPTVTCQQVQQNQTILCESSRMLTATQRHEPTWPDSDTGEIYFHHQPERTVVQCYLRQKQAALAVIASSAGHLDSHYMLMQERGRLL